MRWTLIFLVTLWSLMVFAPPLHADVSASTTSSSGSERSSICLTPEQWDALEDEIWKETEKTVTEAVEAATIPLYHQIVAQQKTICWLKFGCVSLSVGLGSVLLYALLK